VLVVVFSVVEWPNAADRPKAEREGFAYGEST